MEWLQRRRGKIKSIIIRIEMLFLTAKSVTRKCNADGDVDGNTGNTNNDKIITIAIFE